MPSLRNSDDADFLRGQLSRTVGILLSAFMRTAEPADRREFDDAQSGNDPLAAGVVLDRCLNFPGAEERLQAAIDATRRTMNDTIADEYSAYVRDRASRN